MQQILPKLDEDTPFRKILSHKNFQEDATPNDYEETLNETSRRQVIELSKKMTEEKPF